MVNSEQNLLIEGLVYCCPQWLLIVPDGMPSGRVGMRGTLSDQRSVIRRFFSVFSVRSVRALSFLRVLRVLRGWKSVTFRATPWRSVFSAPSAVN